MTEPGSVCSTCGAGVRADATFCTTCGTPIARVPAPASPEPAPAPAEPAPAPAAPGSTPTDPAPDAAAQPETLTDLARRFLGGPGPLGAVGGLAAVWVLGGFFSRQLWGVLGWPAEQVQSFVSERNCIGETPGTSAMYLCSARVGFFQVLGPLVIALLALGFRRPLGTAMARLRTRLPAGQSLVAPLAATTLFTMAYSPMHADTAYQEGLVSQKTFPAVVGVATMVMSRFGPAIAAKLQRPLAIRDRIPVLLRIPLALLVPIALAYVLTDQDRVTDTARKEQLVVLVTLATGYLAVLPRSGRLDLGHLLRRRAPGGAR